LLLTDGFRSTSLWQSTLAPRAHDDRASEREYLRNAFERLRESMGVLLGELGASMDSYTVHDISHGVRCTVLERPHRAVVRAFAARAHGRSRAAVDLSAVTDRDDQDDEDLVADLVDDAVIARTDAPFALASGELHRAGRPGLVGEQLDRGLHAAACWEVELAQLPHGCRCDLDAVGHARPRSTLT
jgi:hypothetical protein